MSGDERDDDRTMTLAFDVEALEAVERPRSVFADARTWSRHVGIVSHDPRAGERFARDHDLAQDFFTGNRGKHESLAIAKRQFETDRYVFVGSSEDDRRLADRAGWEYRSIDDAAESAGWALSERDGPLARAVQFFADRL